MKSNYICLRYLILGCFVFLGISGLVVSSATSYFIHQNNRYDHSDDVFENIQGPPATLLVMGLLTCAFAIYFWLVMDYRYNGPQLIMIVMVLIVVTFITASMGMWALVMHERLDIILSTSLEKSLTISKVNDDTPLLNITILKLNCCGYNESMVDLEILSFYHCCNYDKMNSEMRSLCNNIHGTECRHLIINQTRSILHQVFLLALCSALFQSFVIVSVIIHAKFLKKQSMRQRQSLVVAKPSAPYAPP